LCSQCTFEASRRPSGRPQVGQPPGVVDLQYEASVEQLFDFFTDEVLPLNGLLPGPLLDWSGIRVDLQMVLNHLPRDARHLRRLPGKHVDISLEEGDEREFLFAVQITRIRVVCSASVPTWTVFTGMTSLPEGCTRGAKFEPHWRELDGVGS
jgi:hypothetical protein